MVLMEGARSQQGVTRRKMGQLGHVGIEAWQAVLPVLRTRSDLPGLPPWTPSAACGRDSNAIYSGSGAKSEQRKKGMGTN